MHAEAPGVLGEEINRVPNEPVDGLLDLSDGPTRLSDGAGALQRIR